MLPTSRTMLVMAVLIIALTAVTSSLVHARTEPEPAGISQTTSTPMPTPTVPGYPPPYPPPATPTVVLPPTATIAPPPTATVPAGPPPVVDKWIVARVPAAVIARALANPGLIRGWLQLANPSLPYHYLYNPYRTCLTLANPSIPYAPVFNDLVFKAGCP